VPIPKKLFSVLELPVLTALLDDAGLEIVDVGGRGSALYPLLTLAPFARYYVSEADAEEAARLQEELPRAAPWRAVTLMGEAIAARRGYADLHITSEPGMSSLLEPDARVAERFCLASKFRVVARQTVPTLPLDDAAARYGCTDAAFLKLDTQGSELEILESGPRLVADALLGVYVEASFHAFYEGQPLFADVDRHLRARGFSLFSLSRTMLRRAGYRKALYSKRVAAWAHCLYLREPEAVLEHEGDARRRRFARLLGIAVAFQHFDLAFELVALGARVQLLPDPDLRRLAEDVEASAIMSTRYMRHRAAGTLAADSLLARSVRDKSPSE
jgi:FkbM family methyltransferase